MKNDLARMGLVAVGLWFGAAACGDSSVDDQAGAAGAGGGVPDGGSGAGGAACDVTACPVPSGPCVIRACSASDACIEEPRPDGTRIDEQVEGDCRSRVCQAGQEVAEDDDGDLPIDDDECTLDLCAEGEPAHPPALGEPCGARGVCDDAGACVECIGARACPGTVDECQQPTCEDGACGTSFAADGTVLSAQTAGDCLVDRCDGAGNVETLVDEGDPGDDANPCTIDTCNGARPTFTPVPAGTSCGVALLCDGAGSCVGCLSPADCPPPTNACLTATCVASTCGTTNVADGTACDDASACTAVDTCVSGACAGSSPVICSALDACHVAGTCDPSTGVCSNPDQVDGTACADGNACTQADACQSGACVGTNPVTCSPLDQCHVAGTCDPLSGSCSNPTSPDGSPCMNGAVPGTCQAGFCSVCGDGVLIGNEQCDDGNTAACDGCSPTCLNESSFTYVAGPGLNRPISDDGYNGTLASMACVNVTVPSIGDGMVDYACVALGMSHTWIGDLTMKVVSPGSTSVTLMSRPGFVEASDNGLGSSAEASDLSLTSVISFRDGGPKSAELMGDTIGPTEVVCQQDGACVYAPANGAAAAGTLATFIGQAAPGTWRVCVSDAELGDSGFIDRVRLTIAQ